MHSGTQLAALTRKGATAKCFTTCAENVKVTLASRNGLKHTHYGNIRCATALLLEGKICEKQCNRAHSACTHTHTSPCLESSFHGIIKYHGCQSQACLLPLSSPLHAPGSLANHNEWKCQKLFMCNMLAAIKTAGSEMKMENSIYCPRFLSLSPISPSFSFYLCVLAVEPNK